MSNVSAAKNTSGSNFLDYIPVVSTIKSLVHLFQRCFASKTAESAPPAAESALPARISLSPKSLLRDIVLLIPFIGNIIVGISDFRKTPIVPQNPPRNDLPVSNSISQPSTSPESKHITNAEEALEALRNASTDNKKKNVFNQIDASLKGDREFMKKLFEIAPACFTICEHNFEEDPEMAFIAISKDPTQFKNYSFALKFNIDFLRTALEVITNGNNVEHNPIQSYFFEYFRGTSLSLNPHPISPEQVKVCSEIVLLCPKTVNVLPNQLKTEELKDKFIEKYNFRFRSILIHPNSIDTVFKIR